jgi:WD40 repeat protein
MSADGALAVTITTNDQRELFTTLWATRTGKVVQRFQPKHNNYFVGVCRAHLSPDGSHVVLFSTSGDVIFWKVGQPAQHAFAAGAHTGIGAHTGANFRIAFSSDGTLCVTAGGEEGVRLWRVSTGELLGVFSGHRAKIARLVFHPRQKQLLGMDVLGLCKVWRTDGTQAVSRFEPPPGWTGSVVVNDRADRMFTPTDLLGHSEPRLVLRGQKIVPLPGIPLGFQVFQPGGNLLASVNVRAVELRDSDTGAEVRKIAFTHGPPAHLAFSADGARLVGAVGGDGLRVWDVASGKEIGKAPWHSLVVTGAISGDGKRVAWGSIEGFAAVHDVASGQKLCMMRLPRNASVLSLALNPDGSQLAIGTKDRTIHLFDVPAAPVEKLVVLPDNSPLAHAAPVQALAYSPSGDRLASGSDDGGVKVWEPRARLEAIGLKTQHRVPVQRLLYSPDGAKLIAVSAQHGATVFDGTAAR